MIHSNKKRTKLCDKIEEYTNSESKDNETIKVLSQEVEKWHKENKNFKRDLEAFYIKMGQEIEAKKDIE